MELIQNQQHQGISEDREYRKKNIKSKCKYKQFKIYKNRKHGYEIAQPTRNETAQFLSS
jgi:hypothetical protein